MSHNNNLFIDEREVDAPKSGFEIDMMIQYSIENPHLSFDEVSRCFIFSEIPGKNKYFKQKKEEEINKMIKVLKHKTQN